MNAVRSERYYPWLAGSALLAPLIGGQVSLDPQPLEPGGLLSAVVGEPQGATLAALLIALPMAIGFAFALLRRAVIQVPHLRVGAMWLVFGVLVVASVAMSEYRQMSLQGVTAWISMIAAFFAGVAMSGRKVGGRAIVGSFAVGCALVSAFAIREYASQPDPTWRVIVNWLNPNALAALMAMGTFACLALVNRAGANRLPIIGPMLGATLCVVALVLTGSKGGLLALAVGMAAFVAYRFPRGVKAAAGGLATGLAAVLAGAVLANLLVMSHPKPNPSARTSSAFSRVANAGATQEQSSGFRRLLWDTSIALIKDNPLGRGIGTFRHHSAKPGLVTQTQLAHQSFLQLGVEVGVAGLVAFLAALFLSLFEVIRGTKKLPNESLDLRAGTLAALVAMAGHSLIDSDFSFFGLGFGFFLLLGVLFQLSSDATAPEFTPRPLRVLAGLLLFGTIGGMAYFALLDVRLGQTRYAVNAGDRSAAEAALASAKGLAPTDGRVWVLAARTASSPDERVAALKKSLQYGPTMTAHRLLAQTLLEKGDKWSADMEFLASLKIDGNNLYALRNMLEISRDADAEKADMTAKRLVEIEGLPYFKIRSIPEIVPTETFEARAYLAEKLSGKSKAQMIRPAIEGYLQYATSTVPPVVNFAKAGLDGQYGGISVEDAKTKLTDGIALCGVLADADRSQASWANDAKTALDAALAGLPQ